MKRADHKFVHRVLVLVIVAFVMGIAVVVVKESGEIAKLFSNTTPRDLLLLTAPLAGLAMTGYSLAGKMLSSGGLLSEVAAVAGAYFAFLATALPSFYKQERETGADCRFWQWFCEETLLVRHQGLPPFLLLLALLAILFSLSQARVIRIGSRR